MLELGEDGEGGAPAVDVTLDALEAQLAGMSTGLERSRVRARLVALLSGMEETSVNGEGVGVAEQLQNATTDEVLNFIDRELGG